MCTFFFSHLLNVSNWSQLGQTDHFASTLMLTFKIIEQIFTNNEVTSWRLTQSESQRFHLDTFWIMGTECKVQMILREWKGSSLATSMYAYWHARSACTEVLRSVSGWSKCTQFSSINMKTRTVFVSARMKTEKRIALNLRKTIFLFPFRIAWKPLCKFWI